MDLINNGVLVIPSFHRDPVINMDMTRYYHHRYFNKLTFYKNVYVYANEKYFKMVYE